MVKLGYSIKKYLPVVDGTGPQDHRGLYSSYIDKFGKWSKGRFFTYAHGFRVNAACTANKHTQDYVLCHSTCTKLQYMKHNIKIYKTSMIFITIAFYYECCKSGGKVGVGWETPSHSLTLSWCYIIAPARPCACNFIVYIAYISITTLLFNDFY